MPRGRPALAAACACGGAFAALAIAVAVGAFTWLDGYAVQHWAPGLEPPYGMASIGGSLLPFSTTSSDAIDLASTAVTLPGFVLVSAAVFAAGLAVLWRRGERAEAAAWAVAFVAGNLVEVVSKALLVRPALFTHADGRAYHVVGFDNSYPSGHALRTTLVTALLVRLYRRVWPLAAAWLAGALVLLVVGGAHTVTDVVGGFLLAALLVASVAAAQPVALRGSRPPAGGPG